jgi:XTP/dITP diphosphohydrolase
MPLLIGTSNPGKAAEYRERLAPLGLSIVTLKDLGIDPIEETGETFAENAIMKARAAAEASGLPALADDSGLEIDALGGAPGVHSRRWVGDDPSDLRLFQGILERLRGTALPERTARLKAVLALALPGGRVVTATKAIEGVIVEEDEARADLIIPGYPYRSLFRVEGTGKLYCQLTPEEHHAMNHRFLALQELLPHLQQLCPPKFSRHGSGVSDGTEDQGSGDRSGDAGMHEKFTNAKT